MTNVLVYGLKRAVIKHHQLTTNMIEVMVKSKMAPVALAMCARTSWWRAERGTSASPRRW